MAYWHMTKKVARHPDLGEGETVLHACYGLSADFVALSNVAAGGTSIVLRDSSLTSTQGDLWESDFQGKSGLAAPLVYTGVLALTDERLLYFKKGTVVGRPKKIVATWPLEEVAAVGYDDKILRVRFRDGSVGGLHVPSSQHPKRFLEAFETIAKGKEAD